MATLTITAHFPLGVFHGHEPDGSPALHPDTARLYSALVHAAGSGPMADLRDETLHIRPEVADALIWLEEHPPSELTVPTAVRTGLDRGIAFRQQGTLAGSSKTPKIQVSSQPILTGSVADGDYAWHWDDAPDQACDVINDLCAEVSCLGEAHSPVILRCDSPIQPTHRTATSSQLKPAPLTVRTPTRGRLNALQAEHEAKRAGRAPSVSADRHSTSESLNRTRITTDGLRAQGYAPITPPPPTTSPWNRALVLTSSSELPARDPLAWCVALHKMLVSRLADQAPSSVTGAYLSGVKRPANRVAIQYLGATGTSPGRFLVMLPHDLPAEDVPLIARATAGAPRLFNRQGSVELGEVAGIDLVEFWPEPAAGFNRLWWTQLPMIPDTRRQRDRGGQSWTSEHAALLSVGYAFRDQLGFQTRDYWEITDLVRDAGVRVVQPRPVAKSTPERYVHKLPKGVSIASPYTAFLDLGTLANPRSLIALGQSRHLGGGLLVPVDFPEGASPWL
ncbi:type I-G CRISPR-associated protein Csb2 [Parenemella sanctibonifatiensis]|nr:type I-U CRISPR-associated protein Csb2 [Parenemella sanctibonifatiensis]